MCSVFLSVFGTHYRGEGDMRVSGGAKTAGGCGTSVHVCITRCVSLLGAEYE